MLALTPDQAREYSTRIRLGEQLCFATGPGHIGKWTGKWTFRDGTVVWDELGMGVVAVYGQPQVLYLLDQIANAP